MLRRLSEGSVLPGAGLQTVPDDLLPPRLPDDPLPARLPDDPLPARLPGPGVQTRDLLPETGVLPETGLPHRLPARLPGHLPPGVPV